MKALIVGPGRMGRAIEAALITRGHGVAGRVGRRDSLGATDPSRFDVAFEFTAPESAPSLVDELLELGIPVVSGTTGWDLGAASRKAREKRVPFLHSPNYSVGVAVVRRAVAAIARDLAPFPEFQPGILERHHSAKKDAPSGTAKALAAAVSAAWGEGHEVPVVALRQGGQPGEHVVFFEGADETIEVVHRARSRALFASGAVQAAERLLASGLRGPVPFDSLFERSTL